MREPRPARTGRGSSLVTTRLKAEPMSTILSLADCLKAGRYTLHRSLVNAGVPATRACQAVDVLLGPEPADDDDQVDDEWHPEPPPEFEPGPDDLAEYLAWSRGLEERLLDARMAGDYDDIMDEASKITDADVSLAAGGVG